MAHKHDRQPFQTTILVEAIDSESIHCGLCVALATWKVSRVQRRGHTLIVAAKIGPRFRCDHHVSPALKQMRKQDIRLRRERAELSKTA